MQKQLSYTSMNNQYIKNNFYNLLVWKCCVTLIWGWAWIITPSKGINFTHKCVNFKVTKTEVISAYNVRKLKIVPILDTTEWHLSFTIDLIDSWTYQDNLTLCVKIFVRERWKRKRQIVVEVHIGSVKMFIELQ